MSELTFAEQAYIALAKQFERDLAVEREANDALKKDLKSALSEIATFQLIKGCFQTCKESHGGKTCAEVQEENARAKEFERDLAVERQRSDALKKDVESAQSQIVALELTKGDFQMCKETHGGITCREVQQVNEELLKNIERLQTCLAESIAQVIRYKALSRPPERRDVSVATEYVKPDPSNWQETRKRHRRSSTPPNISSKILRPRRSSPTGRNQTQIMDLDDSSFDDDDDGDYDQKDAQLIDEDTDIDIEALDRDLHVKPTVSNARLFAGKWYKRNHIRSVLGGNLRISKDVRRGARLGVRNIALISMLSHPRVPMAPGADGEAFLGLTHEASLGTKGGPADIFEVFSDKSVQSSKPNAWRYLGTYRFTRAPPLTVDEWRRLPDKVQKSYAEITKDRLDLEDIDISIINTRYLSGEYKCPRIKLTCVGFHRTLQERCGNPPKSYV